MTLCRCPRFHTCNAAVCPLDSTPTVHLSGDKVCYYLLNSGKAGAAERFADDPVFAACVERLPEVCARHRDIERRIDAAGKSGFQGRHLIRKPTDSTVGTVSSALTLG